MTPERCAEIEFLAEMNAPSWPAGPGASRDDIAIDELVLAARELLAENERLGKVVEVVIEEIDLREQGADELDLYAAMEKRLRLGRAYRQEQP